MPISDGFDIVTTISEVTSRNKLSLLAVPDIYIHIDESSLIILMSPVNMVVSSVTSSSTSSSIVCDTSSSKLSMSPKIAPETPISKVTKPLAKLTCCKILSTKKPRPSDNVTAIPFSTCGNKSLLSKSITLHTLLSPLVISTLPVNIVPVSCCSVVMDC